jgi:predicted unusual protein kinase regulating ubiquinone biosynthesis (AarF/ABC1/UbiB family)
MTQLGRLAGSIAGGVVNEGAQRLLSGSRPTLEELLFTPANAQRLTQHFSKMRGAAMKLGQLLSMDSGQVLPAPLTDILASLREEAHQMPLGQVGEVLNRAWGEDWAKQFHRFYFTPLAAASIGQVHQAELKNGRKLAIKIQYPGIRESIDSDVENLGRILKLFRQIPASMDFTPLLEEAKAQLHLEADYLQEAELLNHYANWIKDDDRFVTPQVFNALTTAEVLAMEYLDGQRIEILQQHPASERNRIATDLLELALRELFEWGLVQTDPNFSNYRYEPDSGRIQLLDFGAVRSYPIERKESLDKLISASLQQDRVAMEEMAIEVGYLAAEDPAEYRKQVVDLLSLVSTPLRQDRYEFTDSDLVSRVGGLLTEMRLQGQHGRLPPPDILFLHRKLGGLYLLLARLRAQIAVREMVERFVG